MSKTKMFFRRNGATILTIVAAGGVAVSEALTVRSTIKAIDILKNEKDKPVKEKVKAVAPSCIVPLFATVATIACIFGANKLNKKQQAALMGICATLTNSLADYKKYVRQEFGEEGLEKVQTDIVEEKTKDYTPTEGYELYFDEYSEKWFEAKPTEFLESMYEYNRLFQQNGLVSMGDWYRYIQSIVPDKDEWLDPNDWDDVGYCYSWIEEFDIVVWIDIHIWDGVTKDGLKFHLVSFDFEPQVFSDHPEWEEEGWFPGPGSSDYQFYSDDPQ